MAPLPVNSTARLWLDYNDGINEHSMMWRYDAASTTVAAVMADMSEFLTALETVLYELTILGVRWANLGEDFSSPFTWSGAATYGTGAITAVNAPRELRVEARSFGGRKVHTSLYGYDAGTPGTYRIPVTPASVYEDALNVLKSATTNARYIAIDGELVYFKEYFNIQNNSYWETQARG